MLRISILPKMWDFEPQVLCFWPKSFGQGHFPTDTFWYICRWMVASRGIAVMLQYKVQLGGLGERRKPPVGSRVKPQPQKHFVNFELW